MRWTRRSRPHIRDRAGAATVGESGDRFDPRRCYRWSVSQVLDVDALSRRYGPMVLRRCRRLLGDEDEALDAYQDTFVRLLEYRSRLDDRYPSSLLYRMATNVCLNRIRDRRRAPETPDEEQLRAIACAEAPGA